MNYLDEVNSLDKSFPLQALALEAELHTEPYMS